MINQFALQEQAKHLQSLFNTAEIEINGISKPMPLTSEIDGSKVSFFIDVPANEAGVITRRVIKDKQGRVCWSDPTGKINIVKPDVELRIEIPISLLWKEGI
ncbi:MULTISPECIES: hypothetical protein [Brevibacillus]|uniref:hypothetical protein n=1 Tax=Brevibacillus TaxID=55080 RepID=UPI000E2EE178|nr:MULTISPECIES: hypothetical protein [Brevibacillus]MED1790789.1 hypothetical protein [Brevibacillus laterosporus]RFB33419.1 hypothetical protein DZB91_14435 [Brevibacillus sp. VP]